MLTYLGFLINNSLQGRDQVVHGTFKVLLRHVAILLCILLIGRGLGGGAGNVLLDLFVVLRVGLLC